MQLVSIGDNLHKQIKSCFLGNIGKYVKMLSAENFTHSAQLNNLISHTHFWLSANQITSYNVFIQIHKLNDKQCRSWSDGFFRSHLIWIYTVCKGRGCCEQQDKDNISSLYGTTAGEKHCFRIRKLQRSRPACTSMIHWYILQSAWTRLLRPAGLPGVIL